MIDECNKEKIHTLGEELALTLPNFYGKVLFNIVDGKYVYSNVEQVVKPCGLNKRNKK